MMRGGQPRYSGLAIAMALTLRAMFRLAKPGIIAVLPDGGRFCNEADGYHDYVSAMLRATPAGVAPVSWLVCTRGFQRRWGLGYANPAPAPLRPLVRSGYVKAASTGRGLAETCGIDPGGLERTPAEYNRVAAQGEDPAFGRGSTPFNRSGGAPNWTPNPCVAPILRPPCLAVRVAPGSSEPSPGCERTRGRGWQSDAFLPGPMLRATRAAMRETGVGVLDIELVQIRPEAVELRVRRAATRLTSAGTGGDVRI